MGAGVLGKNGLVLICIGLEGCGAAVFNCADDEACEGGVCEATGHCSFPDPTCASGRRYGEHSGSLSGQCVPPETATEDASTSLPTSTSTTTPPGSDTSESTAAVSVTITGSTTSGDATTSGSSTSAADSSSTGEPTLDPSLVAWYRFEDDLAGVVLDSTDNALDGSCAPGACPISVPGPIGNAAEFDGIDDVVVVPDDPLLRTTEGVTVTAWIRLDTFDVAVNRAVVNKLVGTQIDNSWELFIRPGIGAASDEMQWELVGDKGGHELVWDTAVEPGTWFHVAGIWEPGHAELYVDGDLFSAEMSLASLLFDEGALRIGGDFDYGVGSNFMSGAIDDVRIYSRVLDGDEVLAIYELGAP